MAEKLTLARPYAKAAFEVAHQNKQYEMWSQVLMMLSWIVEDKRADQLLRNQTVGTETLMEFFLEICDSYLPLQGQNFVRVLAYYRRLNLLPFISEIYEKLKADIEGTLKVELTSAKILSSKQQEDFSKKLEAYFGKAIKLECLVKKELIAGFVVKAGDCVIDNSIKGGLRKLQEAMGG